MRFTYINYLFTLFLLAHAITVVYASDSLRQARVSCLEKDKKSARRIEETLLLLQNRVLKFIQRSKLHHNSKSAASLLKARPKRDRIRSLSEPRTVAGKKIIGNRLSDARMWWYEGQEPQKQPARSLLLENLELHDSQFEPYQGFLVTQSNRRNVFFFPYGVADNKTYWIAVPNTPYHMKLKENKVVAKWEVTTWTSQKPTFWFNNYLTGGRDTKNKKIISLDRVTLHLHGKNALILSTDAVKKILGNQFQRERGSKREASRGFKRWF